MKFILRYVRCATCAQNRYIFQMSAMIISLSQAKLAHAPIVDATEDIKHYARARACVCRVVLCIVNEKCIQRNNVGEM